MTAATKSEYTEPATTLFLAFELGERHWKLGFTTGFGQKARERTITGRDLVHVADDDMLVAALPHGARPIMDAGNLLAQISTDMLHKIGQMLGISGYEKCVVMRAENGQAADGHVVEVLGPAEDSDDDVVELVGRSEQVTVLDGDVGHLHEGEGGEVA